MNHVWIICQLSFPEMNSISIHYIVKLQGVWKVTVHLYIYAMEGHLKKCNGMPVQNMLWEAPSICAVAGHLKIRVQGRYLRVL